MARNRRSLPIFDTEVLRLGPKGVGIGTAPDDRPVHVRGVPVGAVVRIRPAGRRKGIWRGRRLEIVESAPNQVPPRCSLFGLCGGCVLQEMPLDAQRDAKTELAHNLCDTAHDGPWASTPKQHPPRGVDAPYGYRNKVELSFGSRRYLNQADMDAGLPLDGRYLGMHAPGRFDRVVDAERCELISDAANALLATTRRIALADEAPAPWNVHTHEGFWRHLVLREGFRTGELLVALYTAPATTPDQEQAVAALADALLATPLEGARLTGIVWGENDGVADVARGEIRRVWGEPWLHEMLGSTRFRISPTAFFQTSTSGAEVLYDTIAEALGQPVATLVDLYCGAGSIGLYLADRYERLVGIETVDAAIEDAKVNAELNGVAHATFRCAKVEDALDVLDSVSGPRHLVVDPPRAGLHPSVAKRLATTNAEVLVYVACHPSSLGRDAAILEEGGWRLTDTWTVDLFPHTGHVEMVGRFVKPGRVEA